MEFIKTKIKNPSPSYLQNLICKRYANIQKHINKERQDIKLAVPEWFFELNVMGIRVKKGEKTELKLFNIENARQRPDKRARFIIDSLDKEL